MLKVFDGVTHLDNNKKRHRVSTVLIYLTTSEAVDGGKTAFPCVMPKGASSEQARERKSLCDLAASTSTAPAFAYGPDNDPHGLYAIAVKICDGTVRATTSPNSQRFFMCPNS